MCGYKSNAKEAYFFFKKDIKLSGDVKVTCTSPLCYLTHKPFRWNVIEYKCPSSTGMQSGGEVKIIS
jgi:hypothetical protein